MSFPDLVQETPEVLYSKATGVPGDGPNVFEVGVPPILIDPRWTVVLVTPIGDSIRDAWFVSFSEERDRITVHFEQDGDGEATVELFVIERCVIPSR